MFTSAPSLGLNTFVLSQGLGTPLGGLTPVREASPCVTHPQENHDEKGDNSFLRRLIDEMFIKSNESNSIKISSFGRGFW